MQGAKGVDEVPGIDSIASQADLRFANTSDELRVAIKDAEIMLGWNFQAGGLRGAWNDRTCLRWIHWCGAGVDAVLFPALVQSDTVLTNARGVFDRAMAEYVLGVIIAFAKRFPETITYQLKRTWQHRLTECIEGQHVLVVGVGSIGGAVARLLRSVGLNVVGVGRRARSEDPEFGVVHPQGKLNQLLPEADYVVIVAPLTEETIGMFGTEQYRAMKPTARLVNVGRGRIIDETALIKALQDREIAGAALDVFETEPLPQDSPLWSMANVIVSPHMSGDFVDYPRALADSFLENFRRFTAGEPLLNVVDKTQGYVPR